MKKQLSRLWATKFRLNVERRHKIFWKLLFQWSHEQRWSTMLPAEWSLRSFLGINNHSRRQEAGLEIKPAYRLSVCFGWLSKPSEGSWVGKVWRTSNSAQYPWAAGPLRTAAVCCRALLVEISTDGSIALSLGSQDCSSVPATVVSF